MSGHSKWHNIQKTKGAADAKRSATFTKIAKEIIVAVKQGHDDLLGDLGECGAALGVGRPLGLLNIVPLGMS